MIIPTFAISSEIPEGIWRRPGNDAINSLYMFLRLNGYEESYETFVSQTQSLRDEATLSSLRDTAHELGYPTNVVKSSMEQVLMPNFPKPAILFCEHSGIEGCKWHLLLSANERYVVLLTGETMFIHLVSVDKFRSTWSGYTLTAKSQPSPLATVLRYLSLAGAGLATLSLMFFRIAGSDQ
jgi:ABC-type bacteriocin/lantibiotic exporter with double-glycine peptidase domain